MITRSQFRPAWWLPGAHLQTLYPTLCRRRLQPPLGRERLELADGDFIDLDWTDSNGGPIVLVLHGLEGSLASHYTGGILKALAARGYHAVLMYFRGCSGEPNRLPRSYHSGDTADLQAVLDHIRVRHPAAPLAVIGYSLGGNVLLKWLGEKGKAAPLATAVAVSVPFELDSAARRLEQGLSRLYQHHLVGKLRRSVRQKASVHPPPPLPLENLPRLVTFRQFDDAVTAPLHGFNGVDDYYRRSSSRQYLDRIAVPTLILQARDDPFLPVSAIPVDTDLSEAVTLELSPRGGHVGFIAGRIPFAANYWLETRICHHLRECLAVATPGSERKPGNMP
jgi:predicted alpha/beta-fold hydrolase